MIKELRLFWWVMSKRIFWKVCWLRMFLSSICITVLFTILLLNKNTLPFWPLTRHKERVSLFPYSTWWLNSFFERSLCKDWDRPMRFWRVLISWNVSLNIQASIWRLNNGIQIRHNRLTWWFVESPERHQLCYLKNVWKSPRIDKMVSKVDRRCFIQGDYSRSLVDKLCRLSAVNDNIQLLSGSKNSFNRVRIGFYIWK